MSNTPPPCPPEIREQMVELVRAGRSPEELAREFEPSAQTIRNWLGRADRNERRRPDGLTSASRDELRRLRRENRRLARQPSHAASADKLGLQERDIASLEKGDPVEPPWDACCMPGGAEGVAS